MHFHSIEYFFEHYHYQHYQLPGPCAVGRGQPYRICRDDLTNEELAEVEHVGFCTKTNRFACVRAFSFAGCCHNPCSTLTSDSHYEGVPLTDQYGCQIRCEQSHHCAGDYQQGGAPSGTPVICVQGACCVKPLYVIRKTFRFKSLFNNILLSRFDPNPDFKSKEVFRGQDGYHFVRRRRR